ncbi:uncharacterized protein LOC118190720 [Stegodyphus dumicola]|uniref:uncharacterized protein LOC118190720 n=1 Tax=Stegodyphus dumicola TaxID=202533 RepID=UPI0015AEA4A3|nr:uncharacterized protein LOC118190720 [Stegodyphus dumicola]XP_035217381.1 uncharacterized protein LOC118190720 [Stegodyphus dumicola]
MYSSGMKAVTLKKVFLLIRIPVMNIYLKTLVVLAGVLLQVLLNEAEQVPGTPGVDYPTYFEIPKTSFRCSQQKYIPGFYADTETGCQVFHSCYKHRQESYLCPTGTTFNQAILACDYWYSSNCSLAPLFYNVNAYDKHEISEVRSYPMHTYSEDVFNKMASLYDSSSALPPVEVASAYKLDDDDHEQNSVPEIEFEEKAETTEEKDQESLDFERYFQITRNTGGLSFHEMVNDLYPSADRVFPPRKISIPLPGSYVNDNRKLLKVDEVLSEPEGNSKASGNEDKKNLKAQSLFSSNKKQHKELDIETPSVKYEGEMLGDIVASGWNSVECFGR